MVVVPEIREIPLTPLVGMNVRMCLSNNKTGKLWGNFMPKRNLIPGIIGSYMYSIEVYDSPDSIQNFTPNTEYEKWAAVPVTNQVVPPEGLKYFEILKGLYAVFTYKGKPSEAPPFYQYIYGDWLPSSVYSLDDRPHFAKMGEKYLGEHPDSEEDICIPITKD